MKICDYAFLSDCQSAALVSHGGSVDWFCSPRFDSSSVFARILDPDAGHWHIRPRQPWQVRRAYVENTLVVESIFETGSGSVSITDALVLEAGSRGHEIGLRSPHVLIREVRGLSGSVPLETEFAPRMEYGLTLPLFQTVEGGVRATGGPLMLDLESATELIVNDEGAYAEFNVAEGEILRFRLACSPAFSEHRPVIFPEGISIDETVASWRSLAELHTGYQGLYQAEVSSSALVLQGLTYQPSGAIVAAATTSLPEIIGGVANWDYRYAWLRDISLMMMALWVAACPDEPESFFRWINQTGTGREGTMQIMFGVGGERDLSEHLLENLAGFRGSRPVRIGNEAWRQKQLDIFGEVIDAAFLLRDRLKPFSGTTRKLITGLAEQAAARWQEPDAGMWEARDGERHYTSSKVMCWVALDRAIAMEDELALDETQVAEWRTVRDEIHAAVIDRAWSHNTDAFAGAFGSDELDASVLLMPLVGFLPATDPRMLATIEAVFSHLCVNGHVRRWQAEENGFIICSYWLVECLALAGHYGRAKDLFESITASANDLGLLSEEIDPVSGELLGNFPQAFSHVGLINAAWRLSQLK